MLPSLKNTTRILPAAVGFFILLAITGCNDSSDTKSSNVTTADSTVTATATDTATSAPSTTRVKPRKKGSGSTMIVADPKTGKTRVEKDKDGIYAHTETMPEFPGGAAALSKYVEDNLSYPQDALDNNTEGTVKVSFIIDEKGKVLDPVVLGTSVNKSLDLEATRVVKRMPAWKPGTVKGKNVKTRLELPITFKLSDS